MTFIVPYWIGKVKLFILLMPQFFYQTPNLYFDLKKRPCATRPRFPLSTLSASFFIMSKINSEHCIGLKPYLCYHLIFLTYGVKMESHFKIAIFAY